MISQFNRLYRGLAFLSALFLISCMEQFPLEEYALQTEVNASMMVSDWESGDVFFDENEWTEAVAGNMPLVISVPHGGNLTPSHIPDRTCNNPTTVTDANTRELARAIEQEFIQEYNIRPYLVFCHLKRSKIDQNRGIANGTCGNAEMEAAWHKFHNYIDTALNHAVAAHGRAVYIDLHGHGHSNLRLELGYSLSRSELEDVYNGNNLLALAQESTIRNLLQLNPYLDFREMLMGGDAFGTMMHEEGFPSVPSQQDPYPNVGEPYFNGGYNTVLYTSEDYPNVHGWQIECNRVGVRDNATNRAEFAKAFAKTMVAYLGLTEPSGPIDASDPVDTYQVTLDRPGYLNGDRFLDASTGATYGYPNAVIPLDGEAFYHQEKVDFAFFNGSSSGPNFISPSDASRLSSWGTGDDINADWLVKNEGTFLRLEASATADSIFSNTLTIGELHQAYQAAQTLVPAQTGYSVGKHGLGKHISGMDTGDLIFFRSSSKKILVLFKVTAYSSGGGGSISLSAKADLTQKVNVPPSPDALKFGTLAVGGWSALGPEGDTYHVDLANIARHNPASADANQSSIDLLNLWSGGGYANFMAPSNGAVTAWGSSSRITGWNTRNTGTFVLLSAPTQAEQDTFDDLVSRQTLVQAFTNAEAGIASRPGYTLTKNGPGTRVREMAAGDIIYFKSTTTGRNLYAAIQVEGITLGSSNGREVVDITVKSNMK